MGFNCGIVGLPNVGKSTLFNALTETAAAEAANYPFCTIEPNTGRVAVPDPRLDALAALAKPRPTARKSTRMKPSPPRCWRLKAWPWCMARHLAYRHFFASAMRHRMKI